ncbi:hypothetical protein NDU88_003705 [Pleurodeles waltl]|uniref:Uncharacterized protein n=1 Tax=Pleurodeles waltl TaxID=8319 RepID=A0AAV7T5K7_PLEWA|nr:hypothetical protein NDU88_003705 [Pleurodeles waltl]
MRAATTAVPVPPLLTTTEKPSMIALGAQGIQAHPALERHLEHRKQEKTDSTDKYVAARKHLAISCKFGNLQKELIRDQIIMHASNPNIQELETPLKEVIPLVRQVESTSRCTKAVVEESQNESKFVNVVKITKSKGDDCGMKNYRQYVLSSSKSGPEKNDDVTS